MSFSSMMNDQLVLKKQNSEIVEGIKAAVTPNFIVTERHDVQIESGDLLVRKLPNGLEDTFKIIDPGFYQGMGRISSGYKVTYKKLGIPEAEAEVKNITYNFHGDNARVNNDSVDNSTNNVNSATEITEHIELLKSEVSRLIKGEQQKADALDVVDAIESQLTSEKPSKAVVDTLLAALPHAGSIATIGSFLLSVIAK
ncbi:hypothetical protein Ping_0239 [Psychromonas ingrahamii 37]|uniref:Uncharacterized protein n=1 Tax=Psychromonas ingrahamii (strain DSM 17664 / CCUG 51855 / 37) TaxID=357804 RepID=A1SRJ1_PSYIN|nr:hypothetical protein [Psychromonas ingrahamii]ABM02106.1 hypothetical protein Ping_0239 [Psychromonas ingrahamii 37]